MKKLDEIKGKRQQRFFERRMAKAKAKKRTDVENELVKHADLIGDAKVKAYILKKKDEKRQKELAKWAKQGPGMRKDIEMIEEGSESEAESIEEVIKQKVKKAKKGGVKNKAIKKK